MKLGLQYFLQYPPTDSWTHTLHLYKTLMGVGKVHKIFAHVEIIEVNLMQFIEKC